MRCANFRHNMFLQCGSKSSAIDTAPLDTHSCLGQTAGQPQLPLRSVDFFIVFCFVFPFPPPALLSFFFFFFLFFPFLLPVLFCLFFCPTICFEHRVHACILGHCVFAVLPRNFDDFRNSTRRSKCTSTFYFRKVLAAARTSER